VKFAVAIGVLAVLVAVWGCGGSGGNSQSTPVGQTSSPAEHQLPTVRCGNAMVTHRSTHWRPDATALGRIGFYGTGRNFLKNPKKTKVPVVVEGHKPVTVTITAQDREHARLVVGTPRGFTEVVRARFKPCRDRPETWWPAGFSLRNRQPVELLVQQGSGEPQRLQVGRV
jgi:hypothetical protein